MSNKIYEYAGKHYCETDISETDELYAGTLYDLFWYASHGECKGALCEETLYYSAYNPENIYTEAEDLVEDYFSDCVVGEAPE